MQKYENKLFSGLISEWSYLQQKVDDFLPWRFFDDANEDLLSGWIDQISIYLFLRSDFTGTKAKDKVS